MEKVIEGATKDIGICELKEEQKKAVYLFVGGKDGFISLPTGYGKSNGFALLPLVFDRMRGDVGAIVICISPLTALMMEQRTKFSVRGISTEYISLQQDIEARWYSF